MYGHVNRKIPCVCRAQRPIYCISYSRSCSQLVQREQSGSAPIAKLRTCSSVGKPDNRWQLSNCATKHRSTNNLDVDENIWPVVASVNMKIPETTDSVLCRSNDVWPSITGLELVYECSDRMYRYI